MPNLIQPGAGEHSTRRSAAGLRDQTDNQPDKRPLSSPAALGHVTVNSASMPSV
jgi:hypothetical protein